MDIKLINALEKQKIQSGGVVMSKQPDNYTKLKNWNRTVTCYSGLISYRNELLLSVCFIFIKKLT